MKKTLYQKIFVLVCVLVELYAVQWDAKPVEWELTVNDKTVKINTLEGEANALGDQFNVGTPSLPYKLSRVWSILNFYYGSPFKIPAWDLQVYGDFGKIDCKNPNCAHDGCEAIASGSSGMGNWFGSWVGYGTCNWCYYVLEDSTPVATGTSYVLRHSYSMALTNYGGLDDFGQPTNQVQSPGFTIRSDTNIEYSRYAFIKELKEKEAISLEALLWTDYKGLMSLQTLNHLQSFRPTPLVNKTKLIETYKDEFWSCDFDFSDFEDEDLALSTYEPTEDTATIGFIAYIVSNREDHLSPFASLDNLKILTDEGVEMWNKGEMTFIDPCNKQFLTIKEEPGTKIYTVFPIQGQEVGNEYCILIEGSNELDLNIFAFTSGGASFTPKSLGKSPFVLTPDFYHSYRLRITENTDVLAVNAKHVKLRGEFDFMPETTSFSIKYTVDIPATCTVYLNSKNHDTIIFTAGQLTSTKLYSTDDKPYSYPISYNCEGSIGDLTNTPLILTTAGEMVTQPALIEAGEASSPDIKEPSGRKGWWEQVTGFYDSLVTIIGNFGTLLEILPMLLGVAFTLFIVIKARNMCLEKGKRKKNNGQDAEDEERRSFKNSKRG